MATVPTGINLRAAIPGQELHELYVAQGLTIEKVAARFGVSTATIARRFTDVGIRPRRRGPGWRRQGSPEEEFAWTPELAYAVGLIATDGCLSRDGRHLSVASKDRDLLDTVKRCLNVTARITSDGGCLRLQWGDVLLFRWLVDIGLMPAKSLRLGPLDVPDSCFPDFLRGCIDGDGSIRTYVDRYNTFKNPRYIYTRLYLSLVSASPVFIEWIRASLQRFVGVSGDLSVRRFEKTSDVWCLRYAKRESLILLRWMYYGDDVPCLRRKRELAAPFLARGAPPSRRGPGRPMVL
jgi:AraC-like DNA-binding protein